MSGFIYPSEYTPIPATAVADEILGYHGRMITPSKSGYHDRYPDGWPVFNANVLTKEDGKVWYGDLDLMKDGERLSVLATLLGKRVYVLYESDARFDNEEKPLFEEAVATYDPMTDAQKEDLSFPVVSAEPPKDQPRKGES